MVYSRVSQDMQKVSLNCMIFACPMNSVTLWKHGVEYLDLYFLKGET